MFQNLLHGGRGNFNNPYGRWCVEKAAPNFPGVPELAALSRPGGRVRGPPGYWPVNGRAPRDYFLPIFINKYTWYLTVSTGAARLPARVFHKSIPGPVH